MAYCLNNLCLCYRWYVGRKVREAVNLVVNNGMKIRQTATNRNLSFQTLSSYLKKSRDDPLCWMVPNYNVNKFFSMELEQALINYIITCSKLFYGLTITDCCKLTFDLVKANNIRVPDNWEISRKASIDCYKGFWKKHPNISLRTPEGCSLARPVGFNKVNIEVFFYKIRKCFAPHKLFN